jgi:hypothetical protein
MAKPKVNFKFSIKIAISKPQEGHLRPQQMEQRENHQSKEGAHF